MKKLYYKILRLDNKGYGAYKTLRGSYWNGGLELNIFHIQGDPYAQPSKITLKVPKDQTSIPSECWSSPAQKIATADYLHRLLYKRLDEGFELPNRENPAGIPYLRVPKPLEIVLARSAVQLTDEGVEFRMFAGLPGKGRKIEARECSDLLCERVPAICGEVSFFSDADRKELKVYTDSYLKQEFLREKLSENSWVAFVENGAILPRLSGDSEEPMDKAIPFSSPKTLNVELESPWGTISGMALKKGLNLIVGGAFHGKSTLHDAMKLGVYNHIPGDGREGVVTLAESVELQSENGRSIRRTNLQPMFQNLPAGDASCFSTDNASGSTSQVASLVEAMQFGAKVMFLDEDECSVNFLYKDNLMKELIPTSVDSLVPLLDCLEGVQKNDVSLVLVAGASGEYFSKADCVIVADKYQYLDKTVEAKKVVTSKRDALTARGGFQTTRTVSNDWFVETQKRIQRHTKPRTKDVRRLEWCGVSVDGSSLETLKSQEQYQTVLRLIQRWVTQNAGSGDVDIKETVKELKDFKMSWIDDGGSPDFASIHMSDFWRVLFRTSC